MRWRELLMVAMLVIPNQRAYAGAPVIDWADIAFDILELFEQIAEVMTTVDQLITLYEEMEHWHKQAQKLAGRDGFRLRDIKQFYSTNTLGYFYELEGDLGRLASLIDDGADADSIARELKEVFPQSRRVGDWNTGSFDVGDQFKERLETMQKATALGYSGVTEALATVGSSRKSFEENEDVYESTRDAWENPSNGEQEALDLIHVQMAQLVDLMIQEQVLLTSLANSESAGINHEMTAENQRLLAAEDGLKSLSESMNGFTPVDDQVVR